MPTSEYVVYVPEHVYWRILATPGMPDFRCVVITLFRRLDVSMGLLSVILFLYR